MDATQSKENHQKGVVKFSALHEFPQHNLNENAVDILKFLLDFGANVSIKNSSGATPLMTFVQYGTRVEFIKVLLDYGADIQCTDDNSSNVLHILSKRDEFSIDTLAFLISNGADVEGKDSCGRTPLMLFIQNTCDINAVTLLLESGANIHCMDDSHNNVLHYFAQNKKKPSLDMLKLLIDCGAHVNTKSNYEKSPLILFLELGLPAFLIKLLLESGVDVSVLDNLCRSALHYCAKYKKEGCEDIINLIIEKGGDINAKDSNKITPLMLCAQEGRSIEIFRVFLIAGARVNCTDRYRKNVLHFYAESENVSLNVVKALIDKGVNVNVCDTNGVTPLLKFLDNSCSVDLVKLLVNAKADVMVRNRFGSGVLHYCARCHHHSLHEIIEFFISHGVDINVTDQKKMTPLCHFVRKARDLEDIKVLIKFGADVHCIDSSQQNLLFACESYENTELCKEVIRYFALTHGLEINHKNESGKTLLGYLIFDGEFDVTVFETLLDLGADMSEGMVRDYSTALHNCAWIKGEESNAVRIVKLLIDKGADVNAKNTEGLTPLALFLRNTCPLSMIRLLIESGAEVSCVDNLSRNVLHLCSYYYADPGVEIIKLLVRKGVDINKKCYNGMTPLLRVVGYGNYKLLDVLLTSGADVNSVNSDLEGCLHLCVLDYHLNIVKIVLRHEIDINARDIHGNTPLMTMVYYISCENIRYLLEHGADVNCRNYESKNALHLCTMINTSPPAEEEEVLELVKLLVEYGVDVNAKDSTGRTPLMKFIEMCDGEKIIEFLIDSGADVTCSDKWGNTALHICCDRSLLIIRNGSKSYDGMLRIIKLLVIGGGDVHSRDSRMQTPLDLLVLKSSRSNMRESLPIIDELLKQMLVKDFEVWEVHVSKLPIDKDVAIKLRKKLNCYSTELETMKNSFIKNHVSFYDLLKERMPNKYKLSLYIKGSKLLSTNSKVMASLFPNYIDLFNSRLRHCVNRAKLLTELDNLSIISTPTDLGCHVVLKSYLINILAKYLNETDMFNFIKASHL